MVDTDKSTELCRHPKRVLQHCPLVHRVLSIVYLRWKVAAFIDEVAASVSKVGNENCFQKVHSFTQCSISMITIKIDDCYLPT